MKECVTPAVSYLSVFIQSTSPCNFPLNLLGRQSDGVQEVNGRSISAGSFNHPLDLRSSFPVSHIHGPFEILLLTTTLQMLNLTFYEHPLFHKFVYELMKDL